MAHSEALVKLVRYVGVTAGRGLTFGGSDTPVGFWCDEFCRLSGHMAQHHRVVVMYGGAMS
jgi:hypothetical protein